MRLLLIEDSKRLQQSVGTGLRRSGYAVDIAGDGEEGLWMAESRDYDAIILDLMLPKLDGLTLLRTLRARGRAGHVLILTARDAVEDRVTGLQAGADDYLVKPFAFSEFLARVRTLLRRGKGVMESTALRAADLELDLLRRRVVRGGQRIE
ncbi:MAG: response regulator, partial [Candidatus Sumerlaeia bacterium]|nr:response regulator [Candidatus Sumerlaeia bacterium]